MIPDYTFTSPESGLPRQPVPVRLVPFVVGMDTEMVVTWLSNHPSMPFAPLIAAWQYAPNGRHRKVRSTTYERLAAKVRAARTPSAKLSLLPRDHFVYSDDLASAFTVYIDTFLDRDIADEANMGLEWNHSVGNLKRIVDQSPDLTGAATISRKRATRKKETQARHQHWKTEIATIRKQSPTKLSHTGACRILAKRPGIGASAETIRRVTK